MTVTAQNVSTGSSNPADAVISKTPPARGLVLATSLVWMLLICLGYWHFSAYESRPSLTAEHPLNFPRNSALVASGTGDTLLMFIHPKCPCTSASLNELAVLSTRCRGKLNAFAVFVKPDKAPPGWERTDYWQRARRIPGVKVVLDDCAREAKTFGALASGETLLYNRDGELVFSGGITGGRGHEGDNQGLDSVTGIINNTNTRCRSTSTYGCALNAPTEAAILKGLNK